MTHTPKNNTLAARRLAKAGIPTAAVYEAGPREVTIARFDKDGDILRGATERHAATAAKTLGWGGFRCGWGGWVLQKDYRLSSDCNVR